MLYEDLDNAIDNGFLDLSSYKDIPLYVSSYLNEKFQMREYQKEAHGRFVYYINDYKNKETPIHLLFNMAT